MAILAVKKYFSAFIPLMMVALISTPPSMARIKKSPTIAQGSMMPRGAANHSQSQLFIPLPVAFPTPEENNWPTTAGGNTSSSALAGDLPILVDQVPALPFCPVGQRFIVNHILFVCHQFGEQRRGFKPFACALRNQADSKLLTRNGSLDDQFFRYKCQHSADGTLRLQALNCILNEIEIKSGQTLRRGHSEYLCIRDSQGLFKLMEKQMLHDFCLPGNRNESLLDGNKCPGITVGAIHAAFGSGNEVIFDTKLMTIVAREKGDDNRKKMTDKNIGKKGGGENGGENAQKGGGKGKKKARPGKNRQRQQQQNNMMINESTPPPPNPSV